MNSVYLATCRHKGEDQYVQCRRETTFLSRQNGRRALTSAAEPGYPPWSLPTSDFPGMLAVLLSNWTAAEAHDTETASPSVSVHHSISTRQYSTGQQSTTHTHNL